MKSVVFQRKEKILYGGKLWWGETLANLANDHKFAKVSPVNFSHSYGS